MRTVSSAGPGREYDGRFLRSGTPGKPARRRGDVATAERPERGRLCYTGPLSHGRTDMAQDLDSLLKKLEDLNRAAKAGGIPRDQLEEQVKQITVAVKKAMQEVTNQLPPELAGASGVLVDVFKAQLGAILQQSGLELQESEEMQKLSEELELIKRSYIRS